MNPLLLVDSYKIHHHTMYPQNMTKLYSNFTPRKSRIEGINSVIVFGIQHFIKEYLIDAFNEKFFIFPRDQRQGVSERDFLSTTAYLKKEVIDEYKRHCPVDTKHIEDLWDLGYLPLEIKTLDEGTECPIGVPLLTITNTHPDFGWLVNYLETLLSCVLWQPITSATIAYYFKQLLDEWAIKTTGTSEGTQWQGHDFSLRGMSSPESGILSGMGHLLSFTGTDTIPAIYQLEYSYSASGLIGASVPATEHSVMCMGTKEDEIGTFKHLLELYPSGILSVVSDTWDLWKVLTEYLPTLKDEILARDGKLVIRPDSGDPVDIICGKEFKEFLQLSHVEAYYSGNMNSSRIFKIDDKYGKIIPHSGNDFKWEIYHPTYEDKGVIELLWEVFGGTTNEQGYKVLDSHIGAIYGDSINIDRANRICERLAAKGFASTNIVFGIGSYTYQFNTRDTFGFAMKATYGELTHETGQGIAGEYSTESVPYLRIEPREIFKDPITDDGTKKSKKGLLAVQKVPTSDKGERLFCVEQGSSWLGENTGELTTVFKDGKLVKEVTLDEIRERLKKK